MRRIELSDGGWLTLQDGWLDSASADAALRALLETVRWRQEVITLFGRQIPQPRLSAWYGDPAAVYTYSGLTNTPQPWTPLLAELRGAVEEAAGAGFNAALLNYYRDGKDSMGMHADDEPELGTHPLIASLSLGSSRRFVLRHRKRADGRLDLELGHGSLLVMGGSTQHHYRHGVPKQAGRGARVNLTFRRVG